MIQQRIRGLNSLLAVVQCLFAAAIYWGWFEYYTTVFPLTPATFRIQYTIYGGLFLLGLVAETATRPLHFQSRLLFEASLMKLIPIATRQMVFSLAAVFIFLVLAKDVVISRIFLFTFLPLFLSLLLWTNSYFPRILARRFFRGLHVGRTILVGPQRRASAIREWLESKAQYGFHAVGILTEELAPAGRFLPILGTPADVEKVIREHGISQVILLELPLDNTGELVVSVAEKMGVRLLMLNNLQEHLRHPVIHFEEAGLQFVSFHEEPLENPFNRALKRCFDLAIAASVVVIILPPVALIVWLLQRWQSPGPLVFRQRRAGIQNKEFTIIKFRTMHVANPDETKQATVGDSRVFPAARWLRRFSIDELPQFLNVLSGEMSVVGPRPHLIEHNRQFAELLAGYHIRAFVKPGITGLAQVRGFRGEAKTVEDISARLQSDIAYFENWSLLLDPTIILRTVGQVLRPPPTAY